MALWCGDSCRERRTSPLARGTGSGLRPDPVGKGGTRGNCKRVIYRLFTKDRHRAFAFGMIQKTRHRVFVFSWVLSPKRDIPKKGIAPLPLARYEGQGIVPLPLAGFFHPSMIYQGQGIAPLPLAGFFHPAMMHPSTQESCLGVRHNDRDTHTNMRTCTVSTVATSSCDRRAAAA